MYSADLTAYNIEICPLTLNQCVLLLKSEGCHFLPMYTFENLIDYFILTIMSDTGVLLSTHSHDPC